MDHAPHQRREEPPAWRLDFPPELPITARREEIVVATKRVACDGGGGALGHPLVYMDMGEDDFVECGYCDRRFVLEGDGGGDHH